MDPVADRPFVQLAVADFDPQLHASSAFFVTWTGVIRVDPATGDALVLRRTGEEDRIATPLDIAAAVVEAFDADGVPAAPASGAWLPLAQLVPVLEHLSVEDALATCARMRAPVVEDAAGTALFVRPGRVGDRAGWCVAAPRVDVVG